VIEGYQDERAALNEKIAKSYKDARSAGFNARLLRRIIAERRLDEDTRREQYETLDRYRRSLGMLEGTPLGDAALRARGYQPDGAHEGPIFAPPAPPARGRPRKPFAEQPVGRRGGRRIRAPRTNGEHPDLPPAA
jgi:uncharacterized protein (UPF0335 family)